MASKNDRLKFEFVIPQELKTTNRKKAINPDQILNSICDELLKES